eukprot:1756420-Alexandrium_andersonii.AAC.1
MDEGESNWQPGRHVDEARGERGVGQACSPVGRARRQARPGAIPCVAFDAAQAQVFAPLLLRRAAQLQSGNHWPARAGKCARQTSQAFCSR